MLQLHRHKESTASPVESVAVEIGRFENGRLWIGYHCECDLEHLESGGPKEPERTDRLWQATCFELFVRHPEGSGYSEFNFAPSSQWAAYDFKDYREGMAPLELIVNPKIDIDASAGHFALEVELELPRKFDGSDLALSICAVIQDADGNKSYWALKHPPGEPDFHHGDCFAFKLSAPEKL